MSIEYLKKLSNEEIDKLFHEDPSNEDIFEEYHSRLDWKTPPSFNSAEEEEQFIENLIAEKIGN
ncbi:MAG: hypothetical protein AAF383_16880 [Cyanobacteria bacterium P01_A01_bin.83]